jgi:hypothetical protein
VQKTYCKLQTNGSVTARMIHGARFKKRVAAGGVVLPGSAASYSRGDQPANVVARPVTPRIDSPNPDA